MRLLRKLLLGLCAVFLVILTAHEWITVHQETQQFEQSVRVNLRDLGHLLQETVQHRWEEAGEAAALAVLAQDPLAASSPRVVWVPAGQAIAEAGSGRIRIDLPVVVGGVERGHLALSQSRDSLRGYAHRRIRQLTLLELGLLLATVVLSYGVGTRVFGARLERLVDQARRIGSGDLESRVDVPGGDEISLLGRQMNAMSEQLLQGRLAVEQAEAERLEALAQLRHADRLASIGRLSSVVAHELGTPLNVVLARAKLIAERPGDANEVVRNAEIVHAQAQRMTDAIRTTLGLARRGAVVACVDVCEVAREGLRLLEPLARRKDVRLSLLAEGPSAPVRAHRGEIQQVVTNLVSNALDAVQRAGKIEIEIATVPAPAGRHRAGPFQRLCVRDDGRGIRPPDVPRLFEAFYTTRGDAGTGLGLWIVEGIVRDHGGWIDVESRVGQGTSFQVYLPAADAA
jgi:signal transduction histidine kinase